MPLRRSSRELSTCDLEDLRLGSTAIGVCTKEGVGNSGISEPSAEVILVVEKRPVGLRGSEAMQGDVSLGGPQLH